MSADGIVRVPSTMQVASQHTHQPYAAARVAAAEARHAPQPPPMPPVGTRGGDQAAYTGARTRGHSRSRHGGRKGDALLAEESSSDMDVAARPAPRRPSSLRFLSRWRDERDIANSLLQQHSAWLQAFRNQMTRVASGAAAPAQAFSKGGSSAAAGARQGYPVKLDLGSQELLITLRTK